MANTTMEVYNQPCPNLIIHGYLNMKIIIIKSQNDQSIIEENWADIETALIDDSNIHENIQGRPDAIIINNDILQKSEEILKTIRQIPRLCIVPVFLTKAVSKYYDQTHEGLFTSWPNLIKKAAEINDRVSEMNIDASIDSHDYRLLAFLYSRSMNLEPFENPLTPQIYLYPVAELLGEPDTDYFSWISRFSERSLMTPEKLIDRIRLCPKCEWSHLNFVDICPSCQSLNILKKPFIHCFTCGHVGPQEKFLAHGIMQCPSCHIKLRHIGSDYDRPMENFFCPDCSQSFIEPQIIARCINCGQKNNPADLAPRFIHSYRLTIKGINSARIGSIDDIYAILDNLNYVNPKYFLFLLDWMLGLTKRYPDDEFSMIGINLKNTVELTATLGRHHIYKLIETFAGRLRQLIRTTDISTRTSVHDLWIFLPRTPASGCAILAERIRGLKDLTIQPDGSKFEYNVITFTAPSEAIKGETAELLLARLATSIEN